MSFKTLAFGLLVASSVFAASACTPSGPAAVPYLCDDGKVLDVQYPTDQSAFLQHGGKRVRLSLVLSASGARYAGGGVEWWTKGTGPGSEGTLSELSSDGTVGAVLRTCIEN